jgi:hypothetical protein
VVEILVMTLVGYKPNKGILMDIYEDLVKNAGSLKDAGEEICGIDEFLSSDKVRVASLGDLSGFFRLSEETLVHKAMKDLWAIKENSKGDVIIERLFDPTTNEPLKI